MTGIQILIWQPNNDGKNNLLLQESWWRLVKDCCAPSSSPVAATIWFQLIWWRTVSLRRFGIMESPSLSWNHPHHSSVTVLLVTSTPPPSWTWNIRASPCSQGDLLYFTILLLFAVVINYILCVCVCVCMCVSVCMCVCECVCECVKILHGISM